MSGYLELEFERKIPKVFPQNDKICKKILRKMRGENSFSEERSRHIHEIIFLIL